jgi:hypothetical protein
VHITCADNTTVDDSAATQAAKTGQSNKTVSEADTTPNWRAMAKSTPNLSGAAALATTDKFEGLDGNPVQLVRAVYTRDYVLQCADSPASRIAPPHLRAPVDIARLVCARACTHYKVFSAAPSRTELTIL